MVFHTLADIPGLGPKTVAKLHRLGIESPRDLLYHFPHRYLDFSQIVPISQLQPEQSATIAGTIIKFDNIYTRSHKNLQKALVGDKTGLIELTWFNQPYLVNTIKTGQKMSFAGTVTLYRNRPTIIAPEYGPYSTGRIIAVYPETKGLSSKWFRKAIHTHLSTLLEGQKELLPTSLVKEHQLLDTREALSQIHLPTTPKKLQQALLRLSLNEILSLQSQSLQQRRQWLSLKPAHPLSVSPSAQKQLDEFISTLPFKLTSGQINAWQEIKTDLLMPDKVTNRLLQGDVGSGKTVIATLASLLTSLNGHMTLLLAPTEILARQHFDTFSRLLKPFNIPIFLLTSSTKPDLSRILPHSIIISTHAALYQRKQLQPHLALLIIDEQHKFGVKQRSFVASRLTPPHTLTMTATPIPRTISLTMLGNLDLTTIDTLPRHRLPVKTYLVPPQKTDSCYRWIRQQIQETNCQVFLVCPFIDVSDSLSSVKAATAEFDRLSRQIFPDLKLALIHGKIKPKDREKIINDFQKNRLHILVTTPIIEVGIDIPNASIIVILSADRFGLAQLHQLRGRVGRGNRQSYCCLFTESNQDKAISRLKFLEKHHKGSKIAQYDLKTRGPGQAFSTIQHGFPSLKLADLNDLQIITLGQKIIRQLSADYPRFDISSLISLQSDTPALSN